MYVPINNIEEDNKREERGGRTIIINRKQASKHRRRRPPVSLSHFTWARLKYPWNSIVNFGQPYSNHPPDYYASTNSHAADLPPYWKYKATYVQFALNRGKLGRRFTFGGWNGVFQFSYCGRCINYGASYAAGTPSPIHSFWHIAGTGKSSRLSWRGRSVFPLVSRCRDCRYCGRRRLLGNPHSN